MYKKFTRNPWLIFSPFLLFYIYDIFLNKWPKLYGDEIRYVDFAHNLIHGFYSPPPPHINLWNGPGYPLMLLPFIALKVPVIYITLLNALYQYTAIVFLYKALKLISNNRIALIFSLLLGIYPNALAILPILYTEAFTSFLVSSFVYTVTLFHVKGKRRYGVLAGVILGFLTLTKIIFGYVLLISLAVCMVVLLFKKSRSYYLKSAVILLIAFGVTVPYLFYTYQLTHKVFYWGDSGGMSLYWMSTPYNDEYGDWKLPDLSNRQYPTLFKSAEVVTLLKKNHSKELKFILKHNEVEQDELFKKIAISNIKANPVKFIRNYYYNCSRMLFNFPYSYAYQDAAIVRNIITGSIILWGTVLGIVLTSLNWRRIVSPVKLVLLVTGVYLVLSAALSSYPRQLDVVVPVLLFGIGYLVSNIKKVDLKFTSTENLDNISLVDLSETGIYTEETIGEDNR